MSKPETLSLFPESQTHSGASFSKDRRHRYALWRTWDANLPIVMFVGLNPSTANETQADNTIRRVARFAKDWGYGGFYMMNLWSIVSTDPKYLYKYVKESDFDAQHNINMGHMAGVAAVAKTIVFAWGAFPVVKDLHMDVWLASKFPDAMVLGYCKDGVTPRHPLMVRADAQLQKYKP